MRTGRPARATTVATMSDGPTLVVHPELHASGFGNQLGMLLQQRLKELRLRSLVDLSLINICRCRRRGW